MNIILREIQERDKAPLAELLSRVDAFDADDWGIAMELITISLEPHEQPEYTCVVATDPADTLLGYACFGPTPLTDGTFDLYWIAVEPACAGQGIGSRLLQAVEEKVRQMQGRMVIIETSSEESYGKTRHFYLKGGYILAETIPDFYREGEDRVTYLKRLR